MKTIQFRTMSLILVLLTVLTGCESADSSTVTDIQSTTQATTDVTTTTTTTQATSDVIDPFSNMTTHVKEPWEYVENSASIAEKNGWYLLNEYAEWNDFTIEEETASGDTQYCNYTCDFTYTQLGNQCLQIYAVELVFANNKFDYDYGSMNFRKYRYIDTYEYLFSTKILSPYVDYVGASTHYTEYYTAADRQTPVNSFYALLDTPILIGTQQGGRIRLLFLPAVNDLVEVRLWGKLADVT